MNRDEELGTVINFEASITAGRLNHFVSALHRIDDEAIRLSHFPSAQLETHVPTVRQIPNEAILEISNGTITSRVVGLWNTAILTQVTLSMIGGDYCMAPESYRVGVDLKKMKSILKRADAADDISIEAGIDGAWHVWRFKRGIHQRSLPLLDPEQMLRHPPSHIELSHITTVHLSGKEFKEIVAEAYDVGEALEFRASADGVVFSAKNERTPAEKYIGTLPTGSVELPSIKVRGLYSLDYLYAIVADIVPMDEVIVRFANNTPCEIRYERDGVDVQRILAPRIELR